MRILKLKLHRTDTLCCRRFDLHLLLLLQFLPLLLLILIMYILKKPMIQRLLRRNPLLRIKRQHPLQQINRLRGYLTEQRIEDFAGALRQLPYLLFAGEGDVHGGDVGGADAFDDELDLVFGVEAWEQGGFADHLGEDAAGAPDVDACVVFEHPEKDLGGAIPPRHYVVCHGLYRFLFGFVHQRPGQPKITYLQ